MAGTTTHLFAHESGKSGEIVVLLHGFAGSHAVWRQVVPRLARTHHVLAYDLPGHGRSHPWPEKAKPRIAADAILADLNDRGMRKVHVTGHSMGGSIAMLMALAQPERIASLTLFAPGGLGVEINARLLRRLAAATTELELRACLEAMTGWNTEVEDTAVAEEMALRRRRGQTEALTALAATITRDGRQGVISHDELAGLAMPVSVVWGTIDNVLPAAHTGGLPPSFAVHLLSNVGHMLPLEAPELVASLIARAAR